MALSVKNWEGQAATNSILAASVKSLEERFIEVAEIFQWRETAETRMNDLDASIEEMDKALQETSEKVGKVYGGLKSSKHQQQSAAEAAAAAVALETARRSWRYGIYGVPWSEVAMSFTWIMQGLVCIGLLAEVAFTADVAIKFMTGLFFAVAAVSVAAGLYTMWRARLSVTMWNVVMALECWLLALSAVYLQYAVIEMAKVTTFCGLGALASDSLCVALTFRIQGKVFYGICTMLLSVIVLFFHSMYRDAAEMRTLMSYMKANNRQLAASLGNSRSSSFRSASMGQRSFASAVKLALNQVAPDANGKVGNASATFGHQGSFT